MTDITLSASETPSTESISTTVVTAVAAVKDVDPTDLPPLYDAIDPDALNQLFRSHHQHDAAAMGQVEFTFADCTVVIDGENQVTVTPSDSTTECNLEA